MPRPRPLTDIVSARPNPVESDYHQLTPRTPHSRYDSNGTEDYTDIELDQFINDDTDSHVKTSEQQATPLLSSSLSSRSGNVFISGNRGRASDQSGDRTRKSRVKKSTLSTVFSHLPLLAGVLFAGFLLALVFLSFKDPDALPRYFGVSITNETQPIPSVPAENNHTKPSQASHNILSYENYTNFPLLPTEYRTECYKLNSGYVSHGGYWEPHRMGVLDVAHNDDQLQNYRPTDGQSAAVCSSTITYMLDGTVGLLADLALMVQAAALARERNRTFLVDDTYWNRGKWTDHFQDVRVLQPGPERGCRAPAPEELVACPRLARHWVINSRTALFHFGHEFLNQYEDSYAHQLNRLKPVFIAALESFQETIRPSTEIAALIRAARAELQVASLLSNGRSDPYVAIHIRQGDRKPSSYRFSGKYVPIVDFVDAVEVTWNRLHPERSAKHPFVYIASDAPSALVEFSKSRYSTFSLSQSTDPRIRVLASPEEYRQKTFDELDADVRIQATKGMVVDFALISGMWTLPGDILPEAVVCTISSNICKLAAVGFGWDKAFGAVDDMGQMDDSQKRWVEIDQKGQIIPVWEPFELFA